MRCIACASPSVHTRCGSGSCVPGSGGGAGCWTTVFQFLCDAYWFHASLLRDACRRRTVVVFVEQRFQVVSEVPGAASVTDVALWRSSSSPTSAYS
jgi:hypothetical protein